MSREIFLAAARVHAGLAAGSAATAFCMYGMGDPEVGASYFKHAEQEADLALAWLELAERDRLSETPSQTYLESTATPAHLREEIDAQRSLISQVHDDFVAVGEELRREGMKFREACTIARDAINTLSTYDNTYAINLRTLLQKLEGPVT